MRLTKKLSAALLAVCMTAAIIPSAFAESGSIKSDASTASSDNIPVVLDVASSQLDVTVPTTLNINVSSTGNVTYGAASITNNSYVPVKLSGISVTGNNWTIIAYDADASEILTSEKVNTHEIALKINDGVTGDGGGALTGVTQSPIVKDTPLAVSYSAQLPAQSNAVDSATVANVVFTIGWNS